MNENQKTITTTRLIEFCHIKYTRLHVWMEKNLLGLPDSMPGAGHTTQFDFDDVCAAKIATEILNSTSSTSIAQEAIKMFRAQPDKRDECLLIHAGNKSFDIVWSERFNSSNDAGTRVLGWSAATGSNAIVLIPIPWIVKSVQELFDKLNMVEQLA